MGALKTAASLLARFLLCFALIGCLWIVSIRYRIGPFSYEGPWIVPDNDGAFPHSDGLLLAASLAVLAGLFGLYRSGRISAVLMVLASLLIIARIDQAWGVHGAVDDYKGIPQYALRAALASVLICPLAFLFPGKREADGRVLILCWAALALAAFVIRSHLFGAQGMIGPYYLEIVFPCLLVPELVRQYRRWKLAYGVDRLID